MKRPQKIFESNPSLMNEPAVRELIKEYEHVCDQLIEMDQDAAFKLIPLQPLKQLASEIQKGIQEAKEKDQLAIRFKETPRVDFKEAVDNLEKYIAAYLHDHKIYL